MEIVQRLLKKRADYAILNLYKTPLPLAIFKGHTNVVIKLLEYRADINIQDKYSKTTVYLAVKKKHFKIIQKLLEHRADPKILNKSGQTVLHLAAKHKNAELV